MRQFTQKPESRNPVFQAQLGSSPSNRNEIKGTFQKPTGYEKVYLESPEHSSFQRYQNDNMHESIFDSPEQNEEFYGGQKRVQKENIRGGGLRNDRDDKQ
mgnify:CR=1 FL=1